VCPINAISYENCKFDTQLLRNPEISGIEYQQGTLMGYEIKEYLYEKFNRKCCYCGTTNVPLEVEHIIPKSRGGTDRIDNLCIACGPCNDKKDNMTAAEFGYPDIQKQAKAPLKDVAIINATRWKVYEALTATTLPVECGTGGRTAMNRITHNLPKTHYHDACCVGASTPALKFAATDTLTIKAMGRGTHQRTNVNSSGFPRGYLTRQKCFFGFQTGDMVKATIPKGKHEGTHYGRVACRKTGSFKLYLKDKQIDGINHKHLKLTQGSDGYNYSIERTALPPHA